MPLWSAIYYVIVVKLKLKIQITLVMDRLPTSSILGVQVHASELLVDVYTLKMKVVSGFT